jgi:hypothetical protein
MGKDLRALTVLAALAAAVSTHAFAVQSPPAQAAKPAAPTPAAAPSRPDQAAFRELYKELVETNTTLSAGNCRRA